MTLNMSAIRVPLLPNVNAGFFHKQILAPLPSRLGSEAHRSSLDSVSQSSRICEQWHPCFFGSAVALALVTREASSAKILSHSSSAPRTRENVVDRQVEKTTLQSTVLATVSVAREN